MKKELVTPFELEAMIQYMNLQLDVIEEKVVMSVQLEKENLITKQRKKVSQVVSDYRDVEREFLLKQFVNVEGESHNQVMTIKPEFSY
ncbi:hypothetical protein [Bacillus massiliigorillae]|uniref:hypothetical protein n=1 Tax=Bacillus massiliigorillae TaxID=1243664 RepID=UPI00039A99B6|nr:hypothetical protein [Bacillus massiliigorillae]